MLSAPVVEEGLSASQIAMIVVIVIVVIIIAIIVTICVVRRYCRKKYTVSVAVGLR